MKSIATNLVLFKLGWLACVISAAKGAPHIGLTVVALVCAVHIASASKPSNSVMLLGLAAAIGLAWESLLTSTGWVVYDGSVLGSNIAPYWIVSMWVLFGTTLNLGFRWLKEKLIVAALVGAIGGPMAFIGGAKAGAVSFSDPVLALSAIGIGWGILMPALMFASRFFDGHTDQVVLVASNSADRIAQ